MLSQGPLTSDLSVAIVPAVTSFTHHQIHDLTENGALDSSQKVLIDTYDTLVFDDNVPVNEVLSFADHVAWAGHAALYRAALNVDGSATTIDDGDIVPDVPVRWGRLSYLNTTEAETGPIESFPASGPGGSGDDIIDYFDEFFDLTEREVVTLMGVHTFGGARRSATGYAGMWTQTKNQFNNDYQLQLVFPLPLFCVAASCTYFSEADTNKDSLDASNLADMQTCKSTNSAEDADRCNGWEQVRMAGFEGAAPKFQWRHSCKHYAADDPNNVEGCTHMMLNIDMGLYLDLENHICTADDEVNQVVATLNRTCEEGMIKSYADSTCESNKGSQRVLASCFNLRQDSSNYIVEDAGDYEGWMADFAPLFDMLLTYNLTGTPTLETLTQPAPSAAPSPAPSEAPSPSPTECSDISRWEYEEVSDDDTIVIRKCRWIERRLNNGDADACDEVGTDGTTAYESCRETCNAC